MATSIDMSDDLFTVSYDICIAEYIWMFMLIYRINVYVSEMHTNIPYLIFNQDVSHNTECVADLTADALLTLYFRLM